jgi:hypothetical protein
VVLEPWANEYPLSPGEALDVEEEGGATGERLELTVEGDHLVLWARSDSLLRAFRDGVELL